MGIKAYFENVLIGLDDLGNTLRGAPPDMTISCSAALARNAGKRWGCWLCRVLDWFDPDHCDNAIRNDAARVEAVEGDLGSG